MSPPIDNLLVVCGVLTGILYLAWRYFCAKSLETQLPRVRSLVPWVGPLVAFITDHTSFILHCKKKYGAAFTITIVGSRIAIVTSRAFITSMHKQVKVARHEPTRARSMERVFEVSQAAASGEPFSQVALPLLARCLSKDHIKPALTTFAQELRFRLESSEPFQSHQSFATAISLRKFLAPLLYASTNIAVFGPDFPNDETHTDFRLLDDQASFFLMALAPWYTRKATAARARLLRSMSTFIDRYWGERHKESEKGKELSGNPALLSDVIDALEGLHFTRKDQVGLLLGIQLGFQSNLSWSIFWLLVHVLRDPGARSRLRAEIDGGMRDVFNGDMGELLASEPAALESAAFGLLSSAVDETLRLTGVNPSVRTALEDMVITDPSGGPNGESASYVIERGQTIMALPRAVHLDDEIFADPTEFKVDRFLATDGKPARFHRKGKLVPKPLMLWGGGSSICIGRHYALHAMKVGIIMLFHLFDMEAMAVVDGNGTELENKTTAPRFNLDRFGGTLTSSDDLIVAFKRRVH